MRNRRLKILSKSEINELYDLPQFTPDEKNKYFTLTKEENKVMQERRTLTSRIHFILQIGYFKATSQFFNCTFDETKKDVSFILQKYFDKEKLSSKTVSQKTCHINQKSIAKLLGYEIDKQIVKQKIRGMLKTKILICGDPIYLFHEILRFTEQNKMSLPSYSSIQDLIGASIIYEEKRLGESLKKNLCHQDWGIIKNMLLKNGNEYFLSELKKDPKSFKQKHIKAEIKKLIDYEMLYKLAKYSLPKLDVTNQNIYYYASLAEHYPISNLKKLSTTKQAIYVLCYAHSRNEKINDNLMISFIHYLEKFKS
ncbi:MAG: DUF4158 domain-containing protein, partial [Proteobacteria bacterium]|nr:DUF4158 domain-containing protein [Pseudomonadota bacterium]